jgi:hypothetical protein
LGQEWRLFGCPGSRLFAPELCLIEKFSRVIEKLKKRDWAKRDSLTKFGSALKM